MCAGVQAEQHAFKPKALTLAGLQHGLTLPGTILSSSQPTFTARMSVTLDSGLQKNAYQLLPGAGKWCGTSEQSRATDLVLLP